MLDEVGLAGQRRDKFRNYSLGMKQRLGIAATLLKKPDLLILDEPTNGLDPGDIQEIRTIMRRLSGRGKTVLISSQVLDEVQQIADTVTIIGHGRLLAEGNVDDVLAPGGQLAARVGVSDHLRAAEILSTAGFVVEPLPNRTLKVSLANRRLDLAVIARLLADQGLNVSELSPIQPDLESVFMDLTAGQHLRPRPDRRRQQPARHRSEQQQRRPDQQRRRDRRRQPEFPEWGGRS